MGPRLVDYLLYEPEDNGILWIKFNRPESLNSLVGPCRGERHGGKSRGIYASRR